jgi:hypothetical protein
MGRSARALAVALLVAVTPQVRSNTQADPTTDVLIALERVLQSGDVAGFVAEAAPSLQEETRAWLAELARTGSVSAAAVRERSRSDQGVFVDVFIRRGDRGTLASWLLELGPGLAPDRGGLREITEIARFDDLVHLALDESRQFDVTDLVVSGPDFTLTLPSGVAFVSEADGAATAFVLRGRAEVRFTPPDEAERRQLQVFGGTRDLVVTTDEAFVRLNPTDFDRFVAGQIVVAPDVLVQARDRAREIFDARSTLTHRIDLADLAPGEWSVLPGSGSLVVDFRPSRDTWLTYSRAPELREDVFLVDRERRRQISLYQSAARSGEDGDLDEWNDDPYDVERTDLDLVFDPARLWFSGRASVHVRMRRAATALSLGLARTLAVSSVSSPGLGRLVALRPTAGDSILVGLPGGVGPGDAFTLDMHYQGRVAPRALANDLMQVTGEIPQDPSQPWSLPTFLFSPAPRYLYTVGTWWYPQSASGRHAAGSIRLTVPADLRVLGTGELISTIDSEPSPELWPTPPRRVRTFQYRADRPVRYLSALVSRLDSIGRTSASTPDAEDVGIEVFVGPGQSHRVRGTPDRVASIVSFFAARLGGAPYASLAVAGLEDTLPGGHSPAYFSILNDAHPASPLSWSRDPVAFANAPDFFLAHEIAHQWFGQAVAGRDYHDRWISEGFAQYLAWLYVASVDGEPAGRRMMARMRDTGGATPAEGPIHLGSRLGHLRNDRRIFRSIVYNKSAVVLHMLRRLVGDDAFFAGLRRVYTEHRFNLIDTDDVRRAFQQDTPLPLDRFFARWIRGAAQPRLRFSWSQISSDTIAVRVVQAGDVFDVPHDVVVHQVDGGSTRITLRIGRADETFVLPGTGPVRRVEFDDPLTIATVLR